jgi:hypothetical protein
MKSVRNILTVLLVAISGIASARPVVPPPGWSVIIVKEPVWLTGISETHEGKLVAPYSADFPPPATRDHFATVHAGCWLANQGRPTMVIYQFRIGVTQSFDKRIYTRSIIDNPADMANPIKYEHYLDPKEKTATTTHIDLANVQRGKRYKYVFEAYEDENRTVLLDRMTQEIVAPLDNVSGCVQLEPGILLAVFPGADKGSPAPIEKLMLACDK